MGNLAKEHNNPMALIQAKPDKWRGLKGSTSSGFLIFENNVYGTRAGFINLVNAYLKRGRNTIEKIIPVYAPAGHGSNVPEAYIKTLSKLTGFARNKEIKSAADLKILGRNIIKIERGLSLDNASFSSGFVHAMDYLGISQADQITASPRKGDAMRNLFLVFLGVLALGYATKSK